MINAYGLYNIILVGFDIYGISRCGSAYMFYTTISYIYFFSLRDSDTLPSTIITASVPSPLT